MRFATLERGGRLGHYRLEGDLATPLSGPPWAGGEPSGPPERWAAAELRAPVAPSKIVCVGRNYAAHAKELGNAVPAEPLLFLKPPSSVVGPSGAVVLPPESSRVEHEAELGVVIGRRARRVAPEAALAHVFGYTAVCDVTARDLQRKDVQFTRGKGFDTFCPVGPWIETELDPSALAVRCFVSGELRQDGNTSNMIFPVATLIAFVSDVMTLEPGDLVVTGTPEGVGPLAAGDALVVEIEGVGRLEVRVSASG
jgi:2-keto-4-pentenoate hydratase/2-oxohepta-3-ene-1,7-dioic acid hydratase in catechol pathway